jgi:hypothetical protein
MIPIFLVVCAAMPRMVGNPMDRGLHSFRFQLNLSTSVHGVTQLNS